MSHQDFPSVDLERLLAVENLPAMPQSAVRLLDLSRDPSTGPIEFAVPIEADPGLTVQVLKFVNSSYFGFRNEISNVRQAITLVGVRTVKNFVLYSAVFSMIPNPRCGLFDLKRLWQDSLRRALFARSLAKALGLKEAEEPFAAALLQDMAVPLLAKEVPEAYNTLFGARTQAESRVRLSRLEEHVFGWTHAEAAGLMARKWKLPDGFATLIEDHLAVDQWVQQKDVQPGKLAVAMSALLPTTTDPAWTEFEMFDKHYRAIRPADGPTAVELLAHVDEEFADFAPVLNISAPQATLVDSYHETAAAPA